MSNIVVYLAMSIERGKAKKAHGLAKQVAFNERGCLMDKLQDRLNRISDLSDRKLLKNILYDVYENIVSYNMEMYDRLEDRIYNEIDDPLNKFYVYTSLEKIENIDPINEFLHPIIPEDLNDVVYDMDDINEKLQKDTKLVLATVFMKCDSITLSQIVGRNKSYKGFVKTDKDIYEINISLQLCKKYIKEIEKLYRAFQHNKKVWSTVNCPYAYKFVDVVLQSALTLKAGEKISEITIDLAEYEKYKEVNVIPLWNITHISVEDKSFPMPSKDRINYEHVVSLEELGSQNGYMIGLDNDDYLYCKRLAKDLTVVSTSGQQHSWNLIKIENISNSRQKSFHYELVSNKRELGFIGRFATVKSLVIRTKAEIDRLLQSYEISRELAFQNVEIKERYDKEIETVDYNLFIDDNIRIDSSKKIMLLKFKPLIREEQDYLLQDKMSFLTSEIQILFPEYKCIGELV